MFSLSVCLIWSLVIMMFSIIFIIMAIYFTLYDLVVFYEWNICFLNTGNIEMAVLLDWMSLWFLGFVTLISSLVIMYSEGYMEGEVYLSRFIILVLLFVLSMIFLIISPNIISILLGWDGLGLVSYCLVIYYQNEKSYNAGMLTALMNRVGDVALLMSIAWMINFGSWNYIYYLSYAKIDYSMMIIAYLVVLAAMTKSAQIPFSSWLPAAMAAPTPVSALVHSSTLVTAGVYLLIRFYKILNESGVLNFMLILAVLTMFMAGMGAMFECDLKKIIALSTLSQLGLMMGILAMGYPTLAYFHLLTHALFKALLFMCAGSMIHNIKSVQDIRYLGVMSMHMPLTSVCFNIANLSLCGMPFLSGFYSSDLILENVSFNLSNSFIWLLFLISTMLTVMYSFRLFYYSMMGDNNFYSNYSFSDSNKFINMGMLMLMFVAVFGGCLLSWMIFPSPILIVLPVLMKLTTLLIIVMGAWLGYEVSKIQFSFDVNSLKSILMSSFIGSMWFLPYLSTKYMSFYPLTLSSNISKSLDCGWSEQLGGQGFYKTFIVLTNNLEHVVDSNLKSYLLIFVLWVILFMMIMLM
uniref:NADH-ubiquinone oxidoreductase chain 5 n=2 Tax=Cylindraustralia sp. HS-2014 TaxID=1564207 RepID=A0A0N7AY42_9ORTH|nr:NADH dehydrogenase subunit 5 [Cylindraustralia sp. HS-2014]